MDEIVISGMQFFGRHGVMPEETVLGQRFVIHLRLSLDLAAAGRSDRVVDTVNYAAVYKSVARVVEGEPVRLLERLATLIANAVLAEQPRVVRVEVSVEKPSAPVAGILDTVGVKLLRDRGRSDLTDSAIEHARSVE